MVIEFFFFFYRVKHIIKFVKMVDRVIISRNCEKCIIYIEAKQIFDPCNQYLVNFRKSR